MSTTGDSDLAGAFAGERIFLIGNGPSLAETPLDALEDEYTMAMNRIDLIYDTVDWRPDFYICTWPEQNVHKQLLNSIIAHLHMEHVRCFLDESWGGEMASYPLTICLPTEGLLDYKRKTPNDISIAEIRDASIEWLEQFWSYDPTQLVYRFHTMYAATQIAMWMGFDEIYLLGVDLGFGGPKYMIYDNGLDPLEYANQKIAYFERAVADRKLFSAFANGLSFKTLDFVIETGILQRLTKFGDKHFHDSYAEYNLSSLSKTEELELRKGHVVISRVCETNGVYVYNATCGGELEVYPRVDLLQTLRS